MGKIQNTTREQKIVLDELSKNKYLSSQFYFTGGTALSSIYFHHRFSEDLDFFSIQKFEQNLVIRFINRLAQKYNFEPTFRKPEELDILIFSLNFRNKKILKVDFNYYPYQKIDKEIIVDGIRVDSLLDIGANKLLTINQRTQVKDYVDFYFLLKKFTVWDLLYAEEAKFQMKFDPFMIAADMLKVETFDSLPRMIKPLTLVQLKNYFRIQATTLAKKVTV